MEKTEDTIWTLDKQLEEAWAKLLESITALWETVEVKTAVSAHHYEKTVVRAFMRCLNCQGGFYASYLGYWPDKADVKSQVSSYIKAHECTC